MTTRSVPRAGLALFLACATCAGSEEPAAPHVAMPRVANMSLVPLPGLEPAIEGQTEATEGEAPDEMAGASVARVEVEGQPEPPAAPTPLHPVFDLGDNRLLAHWYRDGGLHLVAGSVGFVRYAQPGSRGTGWLLSRRLDGVPVAMLERAGSLLVPLDDEVAGKAGAISLRLHSRRRAQLSIALTGRRPSEVDVEAGWQTVSVPVGAGGLRDGENAIRLALRGISEVAVAWIRIGGPLRDQPSPGAEPATNPGALLSFYDPADRSIRLSDRDQLVYHLYLPEYAVLSAEVAGEGPAAAGCKVAVRARAHHAALDAELGGDRQRVDLDPLAGQVARVRLELRGCASARLKSAALLGPGAPPVRHTAPPPRHVILWIMDTLRADRIRPIRPGARPEVPALERLAAEGAVFRHAYVQGNESQTSHASLWTALYPARHEIRSAGKGGTWRLAKNFDLIGEVARKAGLYVTGVTANGMITEGGGWSRGFDQFTNMMREGHPKRINGWIPARRIIERALGTIEGREKQPFFLFVGTIDTHKPWIGHEPWLSQYDPGKYDGVFKNSARAGDLGIKKGSMRCTKTPNERDLARINAIYDSAVSYQDKALGQVLDKLDKWGVSDQTMIIVTADHGEELWEDGRCGHGASLRETLVHVPLFVRYPPLIPPGTVVEEGVEVMDVMPTLAEALGLDPPDPGQGQSLLPLTQGFGRGYPRPSYASQYEYAHTIRVGAWKIWLTRKGGLMLYDLVTDPGEREPVANRPIEARFMIDLLYMFLAHRDVWNKREWGVVSNMTGGAAAALEKAAAAADGKIDR